MSEELIPCGFCGHDEARVIVADYVTDAGCEEATVPLYAASCPYCGARGPMALSEGEAVEAWNRRYERTCRIKLSKTSVWHCDGCGQTIDGNCFADNGGRLTEYRYCPNCGARVVD